MPTPGDQLPGGPQQMARDIADLKRQVRELRAARRLESAAVGAGGLRITGGGRLAMDTPNRVRMVDIGTLTDAQYNHADGSPQQAIQLRREDGGLALACYAYPPSGSEAQSWRLYDRTGNVIMAEDAASGSGLARPYLPVPLGPAYEGSWDYWPRASGTTTTRLWQGRFYKQLPRLALVMQASMDTSGATGTIELAVGGTVRASASVTFSVGYFSLGPYTLDGYDHMQQIDITVQGRRTAGTGALRA
ncbi:hypothetical protein ACFRR6_36150, partial [Streptomyces sp. NPDC056891]|uniref:hypothetical protein n=1 Tax=Streptomyces sp. NPDC056891 TaxID=3345961 RepID=UPI0036C8E19B